MDFRCSIRQLIRLSLAVGLLAAFLAPGPAQAQEPVPRLEAAGIRTPR